MALPISYSVRNVRVRWRVALLAICGIALVVSVFAVLMAMAEGFASALRSTGRLDNAIIVQRGAPSEKHSWVPVGHRDTILADDRLARGPDGRVLASWESLGTVKLPRKSDGRRAHVTFRAVSPKAFEVRGDVRVIAGRPFATGVDEVIVGRRIQDRVRGLELGGTVKHRRRDFRIVGVFDSAGAAFESEIWGEFQNMTTRSKGQADSNCVVVRMKDPTQIPALDGWLRAQPHMQLQALPERRYYEDQAGGLARVLGILAVFVAVVMGVGAVFGAMNTMYAVVAARTREIGTLRAVGFSRRSIVLSFVLESAFLALLGGALGCLLAFPIHGLTTGTGVTPGISELAFAFRITPAIVGCSVAVAVAIGVAGGLLPALRAARLPIPTSLREA